MLQMGIIRQANTGMYTLMPLGLRVLQKLIGIVDSEMNKIGAQKLLLPNLTSVSLWEKTNRLQDIQTEMFSVQDRHKNMFILSPVGCSSCIIKHSYGGSATNFDSAARIMAVFVTLENSNSSSDLFHFSNCKDW